MISCISGKYLSYSFPCNMSPKRPVRTSQLEWNVVAQCVGSVGILRNQKRPDMEGAFRARAVDGVLG